MSIAALVILLAGLAWILAEILVKDPRLLLEIEGTRAFALGGPAVRASGEFRLPSNANDCPVTRPKAA